MLTILFVAVILLEVNENHTAYFSSNIHCEQLSHVRVQVEERKEVYISSNDILLVKDEMLY